MQKSLRPSNQIGCNNLTKIKYCEQHKKQNVNEKKESNNSYDKYIRSKGTNTFYQSSAWKRLRSMAIARDDYLCQSCLQNRTIQRAQVVHHIIEIKDDWSKRLELSNLESLCHSCHNKIHKSSPRA